MTHLTKEDFFKLYCSSKKCIWVISDVYVGVLLKYLNELLQLLQLSLHPGLPLPLVEGVGQQGQSLVEDII